MEAINRKDGLLPRWNNPLLIGAVCFALLLARNLWLYWSYGFAFYPDSNLYVHLGQTLFQTWYVSPLVTFVYPLLNALTNSSAQPGPLMVVQSILGAAAGGFFVWVVARRNAVLALISGLLLLVDLVWGSLTRTLLTDGMFATLNLLGLGLLLLHYQRRDRLPAWELVLAGVLYALVVSIRPSNIFLIVLFPPLYAWLTRSWKQVLLLCAGIAIFFGVVGVINLKGTGRFYILSGSDSYTNDYLAYPLFIYRLYSPTNGPASQALDGYLQTCYPGLDYAAAVDRTEGNAFDSVKNMDFILKQVFPCVQAQKANHNDSRNLLRSAYIESLTANPLNFAGVMAQELAVFLHYDNPSILRWQLDATNNYGCAEIAWCGQMQASRSQWSGSPPLESLYEKAATKLLQVYLAPVGLVARIAPEKQTLPVLLCWAAMVLFLILFGRGQERLLALSANGLILYTALVVVAGLGFNERYAMMLSTAQVVGSALTWYLAGRLLAALLRRLLRAQADPVKPQRAV